MPADVIPMTLIYSGKPECQSPCYCSADMWGAGMLAYMILCARLPFDTHDTSVSVADLYSGELPFSLRDCGWP